MWAVYGRLIGRDTAIVCLTRISHPPLYKKGAVPLPPRHRALSPLPHSFINAPDSRPQSPAGIMSTNKSPLFSLHAPSPSALLLPHLSPTFSLLFPLPHLQPSQLGVTRGRGEGRETPFISRGWEHASHATRRQGGVLPERGSWSMVYERICSQVAWSLKPAAG